MACGYFSPFLHNPDASVRQVQGNSPKEAVNHLMFWYDRLKLNISCQIRNAINHPIFSTICTTYYNLCQAAGRNLVNQTKITTSLDGYNVVN
jgi:hypothetical protein